MAVTGSKAHPRRWQTSSGESGRRGQLFPLNLGMKPGTDGASGIEASFSSYPANHECSISIAFPPRIHDVKGSSGPMCHQQGTSKSTPRSRPFIIPIVVLPGDRFSSSAPRRVPLLIDEDCRLSLILLRRLCNPALAFDTPVPAGRFGRQNPSMSYPPDV